MWNTISYFHCLCIVLWVLDFGFEERISLHGPFRQRPFVWWSLKRKILMINTNSGKCLEFLKPRSCFSLGWWISGFKVEMIFPFVSRPIAWKLEFRDFYNISCECFIHQHVSIHFVFSRVVGCRVSGSSWGIAVPATGPNILS